MMIKLRNLMIVLTGFLISTLANAAPVPPVRTMDVPYADNSPVLDGVMDAAYGDLQTTDYIYPGQLDYWDGTADFTANFAVCWDLSFFYIYTEITDDIEHNYTWDEGNSWEFDNYEVFLQLDTNTAAQTSSDPLAAQIRISRGLDSVQTSGRAPRSSFGYYMEAQTANGWITEIAIPWTAVLEEGALPEDIMNYIDAPIGFDFMGADSDGYDPSVGERDFQTAWDLDGQDGTEDLAWNDCSVFGYINLMYSGQPMDHIPVADAGSNQTVGGGAIVTLNASGSYDPEGEDVTYTWYPPSGITLSDIHAVNPTFTAPNVQTATNYEIGLVVNDGAKNSIMDYVTVRVNLVNHPPVADAGADIYANASELISLKADGSYDPDGYINLDPLWTPLQETRTVTTCRSGEILFVTPIVYQNTTLKFKLEVHDGQYISDPDTVNVNVAGLSIYQDTLYIHDYNTILISVVDDQGNLIAREVDGDLHVELFPNPADQYINISSEKMILEIELLDISGTVVTNYPEINDTAYEMNLSGRTAGNYILRITTETGSVDKQLVLE